MNSNVVYKIVGMRNKVQGNYRWQDHRS